MTPRESLARRALLLPLLPAAWVYGAGARLHRLLYRTGLREARPFAGHVLSVGNLVVGGSGQTPAAAWIAASLRERGRRLVLASRGHRRRHEEPVTVVSDGRHVRCRVDAAGDEALVLAAHAPGVPVLVGRDRALLGHRALSAFGAEILVLDDGFQHHRLRRDLDVVTVDAVQGFGNRRLLPRGPLREPLSALRFADAVVVVDGPLAAADAELLARWTPGAFQVAARRRPSRLRPLTGGAGEAPGSIAGKEVGLLAGLAQPESLRRSVTSLGASVVAERWSPDHHRYRPRDVRGLSREASVWITTEKDAVKILPDWVHPADLRVLAVDLAVTDPHRFLDWLEATLR